MIRILEIDASPRVIPSEVKKLLEPLLNRNWTGVELKMGELPDADYPSSHSSYYVGMRIASSDHYVNHSNQLITDLISFCNSNRLPIIEIPSQHSSFSNLVSDFGWSI